MSSAGDGSSRALSLRWRSSTAGPWSPGVRDGSDFEVSRSGSLAPAGVGSPDDSGGGPAAISISRRASPAVGGIRPEGRVRYRRNGLVGECLGVLMIGVLL